MNYLSDEDFKLAEQNGIDYKNVYNRFYNLGWERERAITKPLRKESMLTKYKEACSHNGISSNTFYSRIYAGMSPEEAANTPIIAPDKRRKAQRRKYTQEQFDIAKSNGICENTVRTRVRTLGWSIEKAITIPVGSQTKWVRYTKL